MSCFRLAHLSDPHLPFEPPARSDQLRIKQRLALLSWLRKRRLISTAVPEQALWDDLAAADADHVAVTGDMVNLGLESEHHAAARWLGRIGPPDRVSAIPGNHDLTVPIAWSEGPGQWAAFMRGDETDDPKNLFPFERRRGSVAIIGLNSALPTRPGSAAGRLGHRQIDYAGALLDRARRDELFRIVLIHHSPLLGPGGPRKALRDRGAFRRLLVRHGAELVLHGHHHTTSLRSLPGRQRSIPCFGVPAALATVARPELAGWLLHEIETRDDHWRIRTTLRRFDPAAARFADCRTWSLRLARQ